MEQRDQDYARHLAKESDHTVIFLILRPSQCAGCNADMEEGSMLTLRDGRALCMACAALAELTFLPSGDPALTRRASKLSSRRAVVVRWARARKRYERQGTLVEEAALAAAREQCAADARQRAAKNAKAAVRRDAADNIYQAAFLAELRRLFPGCPPKEAAEIALHACEKHSGRVGRCAAAKELDPEKIRQAVIAHIRHTHTGYDGFFALGLPKSEARRLIRAKVDQVLEPWTRPPATGKS